MSDDFHPTPDYAIEALVNGPSEQEKMLRRRPVSAAFEGDELVVTLADGARVATPIALYPRLLEATDAQRENHVLMLTGIHWPDLDEDLSIDGMIAGRPAAPRPR